ncbi:glutamate formimidoyltransferase [Anaeropeptidivorans aminofermentans]|uniref:glutamate formimidoyltransferase n=1 Tax=Anaeropeptidivorans aminofermentans TaxID=2934315 RepID=UPI00202449F7|nr:glutamate formimidoyltransferase [Anaeropeptidivorans aminofermentans]
MKKYVHAVPNFSEGRRTEVIEAVVDNFRNKEGIKLMGYFPDEDFNRTVIEVIGELEPLKKALIEMTKTSIKNIDMEHQSGNHPRIGAQDTIPLFPVKNITIEELKEVAEELGKTVYEELGVPVYFSGENARNENRKSIDYIRKGQYEGLKEVAHLPERAPDLGEGKLHPTAGAVIVSAGLRPLVAFNVILDTDDLVVAKNIAKILRGPSGGFTTVRSIGLKFEERNKVAVSMNMFDFEKTPLYRTFELVSLEAKRYGVNVLGSELVGTLPQEALVNSIEYYLKLENFNRDQIIDNHLMDLK